MKERKRIGVKKMVRLERRQQQQSIKRLEWQNDVERGLFDCATRVFRPGLFHHGLSAVIHTKDGKKEIKRIGDKGCGWEEGSSSEKGWVLWVERWGRATGWNGVIGSSGEWREKDEYP
jgi:hypothetical protein